MWKLFQKLVGFEITKVCSQFMVILRPGEFAPAIYQKCDLQQYKILQIIYILQIKPNGIHSQYRILSQFHTMPWIINNYNLFCFHSFGVPRLFTVSFMWRANSCSLHIYLTDNVFVILSTFALFNNLLKSINQSNTLF